MSEAATMPVGATFPGTRAARFVGATYLSLLPLGVFSFVIVPAVLFERGDPVRTVQNIVAHEWLFRTGVVSHVLSQLIVPFLALSMYRLFRAVDHEQSVMMAALAMLCVPVSVVTEVNNLAALGLLGSQEAPFTAAQLQFQALRFVDMRQSGVLLGQVFWGLWLLVLGSLVYRSRFLPKALGVAVVVGAAGYLVDSGAHLLWPDRLTVSQFTAIGELSLPIYLVTRGIGAEAVDGTHAAR